MWITEMPERQTLHTSVASFSANGGKFNLLLPESKLLNLCSRKRERERERESSSIALHFSAKDVHEEREMRSAQSSELGKKRSRCSDEPDRGVVKKDEVDCDDRTPFR